MTEGEQAPTSINEPTSRGDFKRLRADQAVRSKKKKTALWIIIILIILGGLVGGGIAYSRWKSKNLPGQTYPDQGQEHVTPGHQHTYNSNPPTSGWHHSNPAEWGIYKEELPDETLLHNLEHGGIWISYKPDVSDEMKQKSEGLYEKYGRKIIVTPRSKNDTDIALAAWTRLDKFNVNEYSDERVEKFIKAFRNKGPEFVP